MVVACCETATTLGIRVGMTVSQADSLVQTVADAAWILPHDGQADNEALSELAERCAQRLSPLVALEPLDDFLWAGQVLHQPQALLMDVTGVGNLFGGEHQLVAEAQRLLIELGYQGRIAIADTTGAAWAVARCAPHYPKDNFPPAPDSKQNLIHNISPAWIIPPGQQRRAIGPLRVAGLRLRPETTSLLRRLGVEQIEGVLRLPRAGLVSRFGRDLLLRIDQALGEIDEPLPVHHQAPTDRVVVDLEYPTADIDIIGHQLQRMLHTITTGLAARGRGALRLGCRLECQPTSDLPFDATNQLVTDNVSSNKQVLEIRLGLFNPTAATDHLFRLLSGDLQRRRIASPVQRLILAATMTGKLRTRQPMLSDLTNQATDSLADLARLVDLLSGRLGRERVLGAQISHDPLPEQAVRFQPLTGQPTGTLVPGRPISRRKRSSKRNHQDANLKPPAAPNSFHLATPADPLRRPLFLFSKPVVIVPLEVPAEPKFQPPLSYRRAGRVERVIRFWGPERLETGWWNGPMRRRDYFRIENDQGQWLWIYHDLRENTWHAHGIF